MTKSSKDNVNVYHPPNWGQKYSKICLKNSRREPSRTFTWKGQNIQNNSPWGPNNLSLKGLRRLLLSIYIADVVPWVDTWWKHLQDSVKYWRWSKWLSHPLSPLWWCGSSNQYALCEHETLHSLPNIWHFGYHIQEQVTFKACQTHCTSGLTKWLIWKPQWLKYILTL